MATPLVAGAAALIRQYCMDGYYPRGEIQAGNGFIPMGALIRAVIVNSGTQLKAYTEDEGKQRRPEVIRAGHRTRRSRILLDFFEPPL